MGILHYLKRKIVGGSSIQNPAPWLLHQGTVSTTSSVQIDESNALEATAMWNGVLQLSATVGSLPLKLFKRTEKGKEEDIKNPLFIKMSLKPNEEMTSMVMREALTLQMLLYGFAVAQKEFDNSGKIKNIWPLESNRMTPKRVEVDKKFVLIYEYSLDNGNIVIFPREHILHIPYLTTNGLSSLSPIKTTRNAIGLSKALEEYAARFFANNAKPAAVIEIPGGLDKEAMDNFKESWALMTKGLDRAHQTAVLEEGIKLHEYGATPRESQSIEERKFQLDEVARILNMPPHMLKNLDRATFCLPADVEVHTQFGPKRINELQVGDNVWSLGENDKIMLSPVKNIIDNGKDDILKIKTTNRTIRCNANHPILTRVKRHQKCDLGETGGVNIDGKKYHVYWENEYIKAGELKKGDTIIEFDGVPSRNNDLSPLGRVSEGFMEFCGLLMGDGNINRQNNIPSHITIARANNAQYMDYYRDVMTSEFTNEYNKPVHLTEGDRQTRFASRKTAKKLSDLGFSGTAHTKSVPGWVFQLSDNLKLAFLRGFLDADGSVNKKGRISFASCNLRMLSQVRHLCMDVGIPVTNMLSANRLVTLPNGRKFNCTVHTFTCSDPGSNVKIGSHTPVYVERLKNGKPFDRKGRSYPWHGGRGFNYVGLSLARISSIEKDGDENVYDIEVADTHSFIANGVVVHNSNIEHQALDFVRYSLNQILVRMEQNYTVQLLPEKQHTTHFFKHNVDGLLRGDTETRWSAYNKGFLMGVYSPNDILQLEDRNTYEGGDDRYVQMQMVKIQDVGKQLEADLQAQEEQDEGADEGNDDSNGEDDSAEENSRTPEEIRTIEHRARADEAISMVKGDIERFLPIFIKTFQRIVNKEVKAVDKNAEKHLSTRNIKSFKDWLDEFYDNEMRDFTDKVSRPVVLLYMEMIQRDVGAVFNIGTEMNDELREFIDVYMRDLLNRTMMKSKNEILKIIEEGGNILGPTAITSIKNRTGEWLEKKAEKIAIWETNKAANAMSRTKYILSGFIRFQWRTVGENCPFCSRLNGKTVSIQQNFVEKGERMEGINVLKDGTQESTWMTFSQKRKHPPLHRSCDCIIVPSI